MTGGHIRHIASLVECGCRQPWTIDDRVRDSATPFFDLSFIMPEIKTQPEERFVKVDPRRWADDIRGPLVAPQLTENH